MYALLSGLNAAAVGVIALAAVPEGYTDKASRCLVFGGACAGQAEQDIMVIPGSHVMIGTLSSF